MNYKKFLESKKQMSGNFGFKPLWMPDSLFDFQKYLVEWSLKKGRFANFADTGLGKTRIQLTVAENIVRKTNKNVLVLTPLAVSHQTIEEGKKIGVEVKRSRDGQPKGKITVTNYQQLQKFDPYDFEGVILDESSAIKSATGQTRRDVTKFLRKIPYRGFFTATPAPNDFIELGTTSEALNELNYMDMIGRFFRDTQNDKNPAWSTPKFVLKPHSVSDFWEWVSNWARAVRLPSDLGFKDDGYVLPRLNEVEHNLDCTVPLEGEMFKKKARGLKEQREERKLTINERVEKVNELVQGKKHSVIWGHYDYETDLLEKTISNSIQISGRDKDEAKEEKFRAFSDGEIQRLIIKPKIGAWGLNWQHCNHMTFFPSNSYEQYYQAVRRSWRFGQKKEVTVDIITTEGEQGVMENIKRKTNDANNMFKMLVKHMNSNKEIKTEERKVIKINKPNFL